MCVRVHLSPILGTGRRQSKGLEKRRIRHDRRRRVIRIPRRPGELPRGQRGKLVVSSEKLGQKVGVFQVVLPGHAVLGFGKVVDDRAPPQRLSLDLADFLQGVVVPFVVGVIVVEDEAREALRHQLQNASVAALMVINEHDGLRGVNTLGFPIDLGNVSEAAFQLVLHPIQPPVWFNLRIE